MAAGLVDDKAVEAIVTVSDDEMDESRGAAATCAAKRVLETPEADSAAKRARVPGRRTHMSAVGSQASAPLRDGPKNVIEATAWQRTLLSELFGLDLGADGTSYSCKGDATQAAELARFIDHCHGTFNSRNFFAGMNCFGFGFGSVLDVLRRAGVPVPENASCSRKLLSRIPGPEKF